MGIDNNGNETCCKQNHFAWYCYALGLLYLTKAIAPTLMIVQVGLNRFANTKPGGLTEPGLLDTNDM